MTVHTANCTDQNLIFSCFVWFKQIYKSFQKDRVHTRETAPAFMSRQWGSTKQIKNLHLQNINEMSDCFWLLESKLSQKNNTRKAKIMH